jgi:hypothetical protein
MNNEGKYLWQHEKKKRRKKGKVQHIYMTGKEKAHDNKRREEEHMYNGEDYVTKSDLTRLQ